MKKLSLFTLSLFVLLSNCASAKKKYPDLNKLPVIEVNLEDYQGTWYEIAKIPNRFQKDCVKNVTANYTLRDDGKVKVVNQCIDKKGKLKGTRSSGRARLNKKLKRADRLQVTFFKLFGRYQWWTGGDYWVLDLDDNYQHVLVGEPDRKFAWILARDPNLSLDVIDQYKELLEGWKFKSCDLVTTVQKDSNIPGNTSICEL